MEVLKKMKCWLLAKIQMQWLLVIVNCSEQMEVQCQSRRLLLVTFPQLHSVTLTHQCHMLILVFLLTHWLSFLDVGKDGSANARYHSPRTQVGCDGRSIFLQGA